MNPEAPNTNTHIIAARRGSQLSAYPTIEFSKPIQGDKMNAKYLATIILVLIILASTCLAGVTMAQYNRIKSGMSYNKVVSILGQPTEELSSSEMMGITTVMYMWEGNSLGGNMNVMFQNKKVVSKAQFGLK